MRFVKIKLIRNKNKKKYEAIEQPIMKIKTGMIRDFKKEYGYKYNKNNLVHIKNITEEFVDRNLNKVYEFVDIVN